MRYPHGGGTVRGALFLPPGRGPFPAALVLHTRGGLSAHTLLEAQWLASQGFVAYAPDYFTPLGLDPITFDRASFMARQSVAARDLLVGALSCLRERGDVDPGRVGIVGFSLGAYLGLMLAARSDVNAVAAWYSTYAGSPFSTPAQIPFTQLAGAVQRPLLITHGVADQEVSIALARTAQGISRDWAR